MEESPLYPWRGDFAFDDTIGRPLIRITSPNTRIVPAEGDLTVAYEASGIEFEPGSNVKVVVVMNSKMMTFDNPSFAFAVSALKPGKHLVEARIVLMNHDHEIDQVLACDSLTFQYIHIEPNVQWQEEVHGLKTPPIRYRPSVLEASDQTRPMTTFNDKAANGGRGPVIVTTFACNRPEFISLQYASLKRFMRDDWVMLVINDGAEAQQQRAIRDECKILGVKQVRSDAQLGHQGHPSAVVGELVTWAVTKVLVPRFNSSVVLLLEGDMFLVAPVSVLGLLRGRHMAGTPQVSFSPQGDRVRYLWVGLLALDLSKLPEPASLDFRIEHQGWGDTGSELHWYLNAHPEVKVRPLLHTSHISTDNRNLNVFSQEALHRYHDGYKVEVYERSFLHYGSASNWKFGLGFLYFQSSVDFYPEKTEFVTWVVESSLRGERMLTDYDNVFAHDALWDWV